MGIVMVKNGHIMDICTFQKSDPVPLKKFRDSVIGFVNNIDRSAYPNEQLFVYGTNGTYMKAIS